MTNTTTLPPALRSFAFLLDAQPPEVQEAFQFLFSTAMHEAGKFEPRNTRKATKGTKCFRGLRFFVQMATRKITRTVLMTATLALYFQREV